MKVIYDDIIYSLQKNGGGSLYWTQILKNQPEGAVHYIYRGAEDNFFYDETLIRNKKELSPLLLPIKRYINPIIKSDEKYLFHSSYYRYSTNPNAVNITTVHDFTYERYRKDWRSNAHKIQKKNAVMHSDGVICISESTLRDFKEYYPEYKGMIKVISNAYDTHSYYLENEISSNRNNNVLFVGARTDYKRFDLAIALVSCFEDLNLVIIGGGELLSEEQSLLEANLHGRYEKRGYISNEELRELYNHAFFVCYPSEYEGLGCPVLEAQACGCPVVAQHISSIPEVSNEIAVFITDDMISNQERIKKLYDNQYYKNLQEKGLENVKRFSWDKTAKETVAFYKEVYERKRKAMTWEY